MRLQQVFAVDQADAPSQDGNGRPSRSWSSTSATTLPLMAMLPTGSLERQTSSPPTAAICFTSGADGGRIPPATSINSIVGGGAITASSPRLGSRPSR
jgi:hypothetical protein